MKIFLAILLLITGSAFAGFYWYSNAIMPANPNDHTKTTFVISKNQTAYSVVDKLVEQKLIKSVWAGKIFLKISNLGPKLQAGAYQLAPDKPTQDILMSLTSGPSDVWVTIPEGFRREQIAARFAEKLNGPDAEFDPQIFINKTASLEGKLFPDTYLVPTSSSTDLIISQMTANFDRKVGSVTSEQLILASIIEREAKADSERPIIAGILQNRLKASWPLQIDATIQYALGSSSNWWPEVTDTRVPSLFNTYLHQGLPPKPICDPGLASIQAAKNPSQTDYWYYIHDTSSQIHFAKTAAEHAANVDKYLRP